MNLSSSTHRNVSARLWEKLWQLLRFTVVTGVIFLASFFVMNFHAYRQIALSFLNPEGQQAAARVLEKASGDIVANAEDLLPVLDPDQQETRKTFAWVEGTPIVSPDNYLFIPKIGKSAPILDIPEGVEFLALQDWDNLEKSIQETLRSGVGLYPGAAKPGQVGNAFITGHSSYYAWDPGKYKDVFALLSQMAVGDEFTIHFNQQIFNYRVTETLIVNPEDVTVLEQPNDKKIATLMTCHPVGSTRQRFVIHAQQINHLDSTPRLYPALPKQG